MFCSEYTKVSVALLLFMPSVFHINDVLVLWLYVCVVDSYHALVLCSIH